MEECGSQGSIRKKHRYKPTSFEMIIQGMEDKKYDYCLECGGTSQS